MHTGAMRDHMVSDTGGADREGLPLRPFLFPTAAPENGGWTGHCSGWSTPSAVSPVLWSSRLTSARKKSQMDSVYEVNEGPSGALYLGQLHSNKAEVGGLDWAPVSHATPV